MSYMSLKCVALIQHVFRVCECECVWYLVLLYRCEESVCYCDSPAQINPTHTHSLTKHVVASVWDLKSVWGVHKSSCKIKVVKEDVPERVCSGTDAGGWSWRKDDREGSPEHNASTCEGLSCLNYSRVRNHTHQHKHKLHVWPWRVARWAGEGHRSNERAQGWSALCRFYWPAD